MTPRRFPRTFSLLRRLVRHKAGNVAMMFSLMLLPMLGAVGLAVDYGQILTARTKAQVAADAAALQATGVALDLIRESNGGEAATSAALVEAKQRADLLFRAHAEDSGLDDWKADTVITRSGLTITARVDYSVNTDTFIAKLFGEPSYMATGGAAASSSLPAFKDVYVAMDISQSMGLAATQAEMAALFAATGPVPPPASNSPQATNCVFGCHVLTQKEINAGHTKTNQQIAKDKGIRLRIDIMRSAVTDMITKAKNIGGAPTYRFGLYTMGANPTSVRTSKLTEISSVSDNYSALIGKAKSIDLSPNTKAGVGDSYFNEPLGALKSIIPAPGDGSSQDKPRTYVFMITDGVRDIPGSGYRCKYDHCMGVIDPAVCKAIKDRDIIFGVLYTTYLPIYNNPLDPNDKTLQADYVMQLANYGLPQLIAPKLQECASPGWFFEASDAAGIEQAMATMFEKTTVAPALTH